MDAEGNAGAYVWMTYEQVQARIDALGSGMLHEDLAPANDEGLPLFGIYSCNRLEWCLAEQAGNAFSKVPVPFYDTLGPEAVAFVLNQTGIRTVFCGAKETPKLIAVKSERGEEVPLFENVIQFEEVTAEQRAAAEAVGLTLRSIAEVEEVGKANPSPHVPPRPADVATFCYTSGTTGNPKGAMLTHACIMADAAGIVLGGVTLSAEDVHLSYLPLAHMFEKQVQTCLLQEGGSIGFFQGNTAKITSDIGALRPTLFPSVPRLYNKIYDKIMGGVAAKGGVAASLFNKGLAAKKFWLKRGYLEYGFWDGLVFNKVKAKLGLDRCRMMVTGSAPIAPHVMEFLRCVFGCMVLEGYGQTECSAACTLSRPDDQGSLGHVGAIMACNEIRLESVEEMGYSIEDTLHGRVVEDGVVISEGIPCVGRGEVCYRGPNIFQAYYKMPEKTAEAVDAEGWLHSGDIGLWDEVGMLRIVDRKKNIFKLSQGEYVAAEKIEIAYCASPFVAQIFVYGDSLQSCLVAVVVPDADYIKVWAAANGKEGAAFAELCSSTELKAAVEVDLKRVGAEKKLRGFEKARGIYLEAELFSVENGLLTPTFKSKRPNLKAHYRRQIADMYASGIGVVAGQSGLSQGAVGGGGAAGQ